MEPTPICVETDNFIELDEVIRGKVNFVNYSKVAIKGKCMILIKLNDESHQFILYTNDKKQHIKHRTIVGERV
jgi:hypothetical protein